MDHASGPYGQHPDPALNIPYATILSFNECGYLGLVALLLRTLGAALLHRARLRRGGS